MVIAPDLRPGDQFDAVLIFGGDGSVHRHLPPLLAAQIPALVVPTGSGNDFAHSLGIRDRAAALAAWERFCMRGGNVRKVDVGEITPCGNHDSPPAPHLFCCVAGCGFDSAANRRANAMPRWLRSRGGYMLAVVQEAFAYRPQRITVKLDDGATISEPALMAAFANAPSYGHGMRVAPHAKMDDGLLDVIFVRRTGALRLLRLFPRVYFGAHLDLPEIEHRLAARLRVESETPLDIFGDGESLCSTPAEVRVLPRAFRVIVP